MHADYIYSLHAWHAINKHCIYIPDTMHAYSYYIILGLIIEPCIQLLLR